MKRRALLAACAAGSVLRPGRAQDRAPQLLASVPLRDTYGFINLVADVDGTPCSFLLDTGSDAGLIAPGVARRLRLPRAFGVRARLSGTRGDAGEAPVVTIGTLGLGDGLALRHVPMPVGALPAAPAIAPPVAGLIGGDLLRHFAVEIDLPGRALRLFAAGGAPPWTGRFATLPARMVGNRVEVDVRLDGRPLRALLDTGARSRIVSVRAAGVPAGTLAGEPGGITAGIDGHDTVYHWHRFGALEVGGERDANPVLTVVPLETASDMLLGADWFATHVVWISYATATVFVRRP